jgi:hypothetical protein
LRGLPPCKIIDRVARKKILKLDSKRVKAVMAPLLSKQEVAAQVARVKATKKHVASIREEYVIEPTDWGEEVIDGVLKEVGTMDYVAHLLSAREARANFSPENPQDAFTSSES